RRATGESLIEHRTDAVPIARGSDPAERGLLGSHRGRRAEYLLLPDRTERIELCDQAEVENRHVTVRAHEHVRTLDVAVQLVLFVQCNKSVGQLLERLSQALLAEGAARQCPRSIRL